MSSSHDYLKLEPAPRRRLPLPGILFAVFGGPLAWFVQLNANFALASNPCFVDNARTIAPFGGAASWSGIVVIAAVACAVALAAALSAWRIDRLARQESAANQRAVDIGAGRTAFLALWGLCLGLGSALVIVFTAIAFFVLPRCAG